MATTRKPRPLPQWLEKLQSRLPKYRHWSEVVTMLVDFLPERPVWLLCHQCKGAHPVFDPALVIRCACGAYTIYNAQALFYLWTSPYLLRCLEMGFYPHKIKPNPLREALHYYGTGLPPPHSESTVTTRHVNTHGSVNLKRLVENIPTDLTVIQWRRLRGA